MAPLSVWLAVISTRTLQSRIVPCPREPYPRYDMWSGWQYTAPDQARVPVAGFRSRIRTDSVVGIGAGEGVAASRNRRGLSTGVRLRPQVIVPSRPARSQMRNGLRQPSSIGSRRTQGVRVRFEKPRARVFALVKRPSSSEIQLRRSRSPPIEEKVLSRGTSGASFAAGSVGSCDGPRRPDPRALQAHVGIENGCLIRIARRLSIASQNSTHPNWTNR